MSLENKAVLIVVDGLGDRAVKDGKTPLQLAKKPHLDELTKEGSTGLMNTLGVGVIPGSDTAHLAILGYDPAVYYKGRGPFEALGVGFDLKEGDVAFRCNFATVDDSFRVVDRRAGRLKDEGPELAKSLQNLEIEGVEVIFLPSTEHRGTLILRGEGISAAVSDTDPHSAEIIPPLQSMPLGGDDAARRTARIVNKMVRRSYDLLSSHPLNKERQKRGKLPANVLLTRGAGIFQKVKSIKEKYGFTSCCIAGSALYKGVARYAGMKILSVKGATGRVDTDVRAKAEAARKALKQFDFVFLHIKGADNASHDGNLEAKLLMIEKLDLLVSILSQEKACLVITADHSTPICVKRHSSDPVPVLVYGDSVRKDKVTSFDEISVASGSLGQITGLELNKIIVDLMGFGHMMGS